MYKYFTGFSYFVSLLLFFSSCVTHKAVPYFADFSDTAKPYATRTVVYKSPIIQPDDILLITIATLDNSLVSAVNTTNAINAGAQPASGYIVNSHGIVELPFVGDIQLSGLTTTEAQDTIKKAADKLFNDPIVSVRYANFKITVLGEVNHPGSFVMPNEKVTLFDALGTAGDLTDNAKSNSILLVRDSTGENKQMVRLDINSKNIINSPYYFLRPNDMLYVEPTADKLLNTTSANIARQRISLITSAIAVVSTILVLVTRL
jgi:polysaccharide export outer membrane protein